MNNLNFTEQQNREFCIIRIFSQKKTQSLFVYGIICTREHNDVFMLLTHRKRVHKSWIKIVIYTAQFSVFFLHHDHHERGEIKFFFV